MNQLADVNIRSSLGMFSCYDVLQCCWYANCTRLLVYSV